MKLQSITSLTLVTIASVALSSCGSNPTDISNSYPTIPSGTENMTAPAPDAPAPQAEGTQAIPTGHPDPQGRPNMIVSPYRPYNIIDVTGYKSGEIVGDPSTAETNSSTGKVDLSTSKHFRIP